MVLAILAAVLAAQAVGAVDPNRGVVAHWTFDSGKGQVLKEVSGHGHDGVIHRGKWTSGQFGGALEFDGESTWIEVPATPDLHLVNGFTIAAWVRLDSVGKSRDRVIAARADAPRADGGWGFNWGYGSDFWWGSDGDYRRVGNAPVGRWVHLTLVTALQGRIVRFYVNGRQMGEVMYAKRLCKSRFPLLIGRRGQGHFFKGQMDDLILFDRPLTSAQVQALFQRKPLPWPVAVADSAQPPAPPKTIGLEVLGAWEKDLPPLDSSLIHCSRALALRNAGNAPVSLSAFRVNGAAVDSLTLEIHGTPVMVRGVFCDPPQIPPGRVGVVEIKLLGVGRLPPELRLEFQDLSGRRIGVTGRFLPEQTCLEGATFDPDLGGAWFYLRGRPGIRFLRLTCPGTAPVRNVRTPRETVPASGLLPIRVEWEQTLTPGTPVLVRAEASAGTVYAWIRAFPSTFPIGMYRVQRQTVGPDWKPAADRQWLEAYRQTFAVRGKGSRTVPDAWLEDCRRHLIDTIVPDYVRCGGDPGRLPAFGMTAVPYSRYVEKYAGNPAVSAWYSADEPHGIDPARFAASIQQTRTRDPGKPVVVTINPPVLPRGDLFDAIDAGWQDTYPVPHASLEQVRKNVADYRRTIVPKSVVFIPQAWRHAPGRGRFPTPDEERLMVLLSLAAGARGEVYFAYNIEPGEPVEGCGLSKAPEAQALWREIGRINLELQVLKPWLTRGCPAASVRTGKLETVTLLCGDDAAVLVVLNHDYKYGPEGFLPHGHEQVRIRPALPVWLDGATIARVDADGVRTVTRDSGGVGIGDVRTGALLLASSDAMATGILQKRFRMLRRRMARLSRP